MNAARLARGLSPVELPVESMIGSLTEYIAHGPGDNFQPMNSNLGLLPPLERPIKNKQQRQQALIERGVERMRALARQLGRMEPEPWREEALAGAGVAK
jgi:methylenetetrahydrofolate--tRNA-(uracil-5-)-methyltransferase